MESILFGFVHKSFWSHRNSVSISRSDELWTRMVVQKTCFIKTPGKREMFYFTLNCAKRKRARSATWHGEINDETDWLQTRVVVWWGMSLGKYICILFIAVHKAYAPLESKYWIVNNNDSYEFRIKSWAARPKYTYTQQVRLHASSICCSQKVSVFPVRNTVGSCCQSVVMSDTNETSLRSTLV